MLRPKEVVEKWVDAFNRVEENLFEDGQWAILEWRDPLGLRGCGFFQVTDGKILFQRGYWDKLLLFEAAWTSSGMNWGKCKAI